MLPDRRDLPTGDVAMDIRYGTSAGQQPRVLLTLEREGNDMPFDHILGQETAVQTLTRALRAGLAHHAYRFVGKPGVGKEMAAIAFAQALLCDVELLGCGHCESCRRAAAMSAGPPAVPLHPDVVLVGRGLYPEGIIGKKESTEISVQQIRRLVLSRAGYSPHEGKAQVFIIRAADELSIGAANALLKTLEEPRPATHFVLLSSRGERLIDTIRSRSLPVRFGSLSPKLLHAIAVKHNAPKVGLDELIDRAAGSAEALLDGIDPERSQARDEFVQAVLSALDAPDLAPAITLGEAAGRDRSLLRGHLEALAAKFAQHGRRDVGRDPRATLIAAKRHALVTDALDVVERNGSGSLAIATLIGSLRRAHLRRPGVKPPIVIQRR